MKAIHGGASLQILTADQSINGACNDLHSRGGDLRRKRRGINILHCDSCCADQNDLVAEGIGIFFEGNAVVDIRCRVGWVCLSGSGIVDQ